MKTKLFSTFIPTVIALSGTGILLIFTSTKPAAMSTGYSLLALGDSYTIGEKVASQDNFPNQTIRILRDSGLEFTEPEIVAKTGWTTDELQQAIDEHHFKPAYDFVTLLIGVNNQYRGQTVENYRPGFESLLKQAIAFAGGKVSHVIVLSIPDWGVTPFANNRDRKLVAKEIDQYNNVNQEISSNYHVHYVPITDSTRQAAHDQSLLAEDGLHPSAKEYAWWAQKLAAIIEREIH